jgi:hypothetical protein
MLRTPTLTRREAAVLRARLSTSNGREDLSSWSHTMLAEIRAGSRVPHAIMHPLGFTCINLYRSANWGLCMHIWRSQEIPPDLITTPIHSHSWDLSSQVVCGRLENIEVQVVDDSPSPTHRVVEITSSGDTDLIRPTPRLVHCALTESVHIEAGENYCLPAGAFHVSRSRAVGLTATLLLARYGQAAPELALGSLDSCDRVIKRQACSPEDLRLIADVTLRDLTAAHAAERPPPSDGTN